MRDWATRVQKAAPLLIDLLENSTDTDTREYAATALGWMPTMANIVRPALERAAEKDSRQKVRDAAGEALKAIAE